MKTLFFIVISLLCYDLWGQRISDFSEATSLGDNDLFVIVQSGTNKKIRGSNLISPAVADSISVEIGDSMTVIRGYINDTLNYYYTKTQTCDQINDTADVLRSEFLSFSDSSWTRIKVDTIKVLNDAQITITDNVTVGEITIADSIIHPSDYFHISKNQSWFETDNIGAYFDEGKYTGNPEQITLEAVGIKINGGLDGVKISTKLYSDSILSLDDNQISIKSTIDFLDTIRINGALNYTIVDGVHSVLSDGDGTGGYAIGSTVFGGSFEEIDMMTTSNSDTLWFQIGNIGDGTGIIFLQNSTKNTGLTIDSSNIFVKVDNNVMINCLTDSVAIPAKLYADSIYTAKAGAWADYVFQKGYRLIPFNEQVYYWKTYSQLKAHAGTKDGNIVKRLEATVKAVEENYLYDKRVRDILFIFIGILAIWNVILTIKMIKK